MGLKALTISATGGVLDGRRIRPGSVEEGEPEPAEKRQDGSDAGKPASMAQAMEKMRWEQDGEDQAPQSETSRFPAFSRLGGCDPLHCQNRHWGRILFGRKITQTKKVPSGYCNPLIC
jgi:hypothetical protein